MGCTCSHHDILNNNKNNINNLQQSQSNNNDALNRSITPEAHDFIIPTLKQLEPTIKVDYLPETPMNKEAQEKYKYNCPICMNYYTEIFITKCCKHSICINCGIFHIKNKLKKDNTDINTIPTEEILLDVSCPHCNVLNVEFTHVTSDAPRTVRKYIESPLTKDLLNKKKNKKSSKLLFETTNQANNIKILLQEKEKEKGLKEKEEEEVHLSEKIQTQKENNIEKENILNVTELANDQIQNNDAVLPMNVFSSLN